MTIRSGVAGKTGRIRLKGEALAMLRRACFTRDGWRCVACFRRVSWASGQMAHIKSRGSGGSDALENVQTMCAEHHALSHNCNGEPLPRKP